MPTPISITFTIPPFPEGEQMDPSEYAEWIVENMVALASGAFIAGQIGGATPTTNVGIFITSDGKVQYWNGSAYVTSPTVPIGSMMPWAGSTLNPPDTDWLFADGTLLLQTDFPALYSAISTTWNAAGDATGYFRLPNTLGRTIIGNGTGNYNPLNSATIPNGNMIPQVTGSYVGSEWPQYKVSTLADANAPTPRYYYVPYNNKPYNGKFFTGITPPAFVCPWIIRAK